MADAVRLGGSPALMVLVLTEGADFVCTLVCEDGDWPGTAVVSIEVAEAVWTATVVGAEARFEVDKAAVDVVVAAGPEKFRLVCVDGDVDLVWGQGPVSVVGRP